MVVLAFRGQPFSEEETTAHFLTAAAGDAGVNRITMVVAWARSSGLGRLNAELETFRRRGGRLRIIAGIDAGGASLPGLLLAERLADETFVFHDPAGGTFHPKLYLAEGASKAALFVGSSNMTAGGLYGNFEASLEAKFDLPRDVREPAIVGAREFIARLLSERELCLRLTTGLIDAMYRDPRCAISAMETQSRERDEDRDRSDRRPPIFGNANTTRTVVPPLSSEALRQLAALVRRDDDQESARRREHRTLRQPQSASGTSAGRQITRRYFKQILAADAQQLPTSSTSNSMTLTKFRHPIEIAQYFRWELFGDLRWIPDGSDGKETAEIESEVVVGTTSIGRKRFALVHDLRFESGQGNRTTLLRWEAMQDHMRQNDHSGEYVTIERFADSDCRVTISADPIGAFLP